MTPAMFYELQKRYDEREEWQDYRAALVAEVIANTNRDPEKKKEPFTPRDFMPRRREKKAKLQTEDELLENFRMMNAAVGGKEVIKYE
jgi:hypothetical protein